MEKKRNWFKFWVHFTFGVFAGFCIGFIFFSDTRTCPVDWILSQSIIPFLIWETVFGVVFGLIAGYWGDSFWSMGSLAE